MFTVAYTVGDSNPITVTGVRHLDVVPNNDRSQPQSIRLDTGIGGGGQLGAGTIIPIVNVISIDVAVV